MATKRKSKLEPEPTGLPQPERTAIPPEGAEPTPERRDAPPPAEPAPPQRRRRQRKPKGAR